MIHFEPDAAAAIQRVYDDPRLDTLADRVEEVIAELRAGPPFSARVRGKRMHSPKLWLVHIYGNGEMVSLLWDVADDGAVWIHWFGTDLI